MTAPTVFVDRHFLEFGRRLHATPPVTNQSLVRVTRTGVLAGLVTALLGFSHAAAGVGGASPTAAPLSTGAVSTGQAASLSAVSCTGLNDCVAVGSFTTAAGNQLLVDQESDGAWSAGPRIALPADRVWSWGSATPITQFNSISCAATGECVAVGIYKALSGFLPLVAVQHLGVWGSATTVTLPSGAAVGAQRAALFSVSCASIVNCEAVGTYLDSSDQPQPLAVNIAHGTPTAGVEPALPTGAISADQVASLNGIDCTAFDTCEAVGNFVNGSGFEGMILHFTHSTWGPSASGTTLVLPGDALSVGDALGNGLNSISCVTTGNCTTAGQYQVSAGYATMAAVESSGVWASAQTVVAPTVASPVGALSSTLSAIDCPSAASCVASGSYGTTSVQHAMTAILASGTWSTSASPLPANAVASKSSLSLGVKCFTVTACVTVGQYATSSATLADVTTPLTVPNPPTSVTAVASSHQVVVRWTAPHYTGLTTLTSYSVHDVADSLSCTTSALTCTFSALTNGHPYIFMVVATNALGDSVATAPVTATPATKPNPPTITSVVTRYTTLRIYFTAPTDNGGAPITTYQVTTNGGVTWHVRATGTTSSPIIVTGLARKHTYRVAIRAVNVMGVSRASAVLKVTTL